MAKKFLDSLREFAQSLPDATEGVACEGTALEKRTLKVLNKAFLFLGTADLMLKLGDSLGGAAELAGEHPETIRAGAGGWVTVKLAGASPVSARTLKSWIRESYDLMATKPKGKSTGSTPTNRK